VTDSIVARNFPASVAAHTVKFKHDAMSTLDSATATPAT
jgi:hypothetical protein